MGQQSHHVSHKTQPLAFQPEGWKQPLAGFSLPLYNLDAVLGHLYAELDLNEWKKKKN